MNDLSEDLARPTTKDIARYAGVSRSTVDRVLNGRVPVKKATVDKVNEAIRELGFVRNVAAANLAKQRSYRFLHLLPKGGDQFMEELTACIRAAAKAFAGDPVRADVVRIDMHDPHAIASYLATLEPEAFDGLAIMAPRSPQVRDAIFRLRERGLAVFPFVSSQEVDGDDMFVGIDNVSAGATAGLLMGRFIGQRSGAVAVLTETMTAQDSLNRRLGFDRTMRERFPQLDARASLETYGDAERTREILRNIFKHNANVLGIYILSSEARIPLDALRTAEAPTNLVVIAHERTEATTEALRSGRLDAIIRQDPGHLARSVLRRMRARCDQYDIVEAQEKIRTEIILETNL